jgi:hypothetical protein
MREIVIAGTLFDQPGFLYDCQSESLCFTATAREVEFGEIRGLQNADGARVRALAAWKDFLTLWKDADPDAPVIIAVRAKWAKSKVPTATIRVEYS